MYRYKVIPSLEKAPKSFVKDCKREQRWFESVRRRSPLIGSALETATCTPEPQTIHSGLGQVSSSVFGGFPIYPVISKFRDRRTVPNRRRTTEMNTTKTPAGSASHSPLCFAPFLSTKASDCSKPQPSFPSPLPESSRPAAATSRNGRDGRKEGRAGGGHCFIHPSLLQSRAEAETNNRVSRHRLLLRGFSIRSACLHTALSAGAA